MPAVPKPKALAAALCSAALLAGAAPAALARHHHHPPRHPGVHVGPTQTKPSHSALHVGHPLPAKAAIRVQVVRGTARPSHLHVGQQMMSLSIHRRLKK